MSLYVAISETALKATAGSTACQEVGNCDMRTGGVACRDMTSCFVCSTGSHGPHKRGVLPDLPFGFADLFGWVVPREARCLNRRLRCSSCRPFRWRVLRLFDCREREKEGGVLGGGRVSGSWRAFCVVSIFSPVFVVPMPCCCCIQLQRLSSIIDISSSFPLLLLSSRTLAPMRFSSLTTQDRCSSCCFFLLQYFEHHSSGGRADQLELLLLASGVILLHECCWKHSSSPPRDQLNAQLVNTKTTPSSSSSSSLFQI